MADRISFKLDGKPVFAAAGETIWDVAKREGLEIPHLCHVDLPGYRTDGNCRACMVEVKGERVLAASCIRKPIANMEVQTQTERAIKSRKMVFELLASNMRPRELGPDNQAPFWDWASSMGISGSNRYASKFDGEHQIAFGDLESRLESSGVGEIVDIDLRGTGDGLHRLRVVVHVIPPDGIVQPADHMDPVR